MDKILRIMYHFDNGTTIGQSIRQFDVSKDRVIKYRTLFQDRMCLEPTVRISVDVA